MSIYSNIISYNSLIAGFNKVEYSDGAAGYDRQTIASFGGDLEKEIYRLHNELQYFSYKPQPVIFFERKKADNKTRLLSIFSVRDRVAQSAAMINLNKLFEQEFEKESFGFRKGLSRKTAAEQINKLYNDGYTWILDADIKQYFDSVDHEILIKFLRKIIPEKEVINLLLKWVKAECIFNGKRKKITKGLVQGSVVSPMLANLYLDKFDEQIKKEGFKLVRYADDFIILTKEKPEAERALKITEELLTDLNLKIHPEKTKVTSFAEGFNYLGYIFLNSLIVPASKKDTTMPRGGRKKHELTQEAVEKIKNITHRKKPVATAPALENIVEEERLKSSEIGSAFLEALAEKGITLTDFLESQKETEKEAPIPAEAEIEKAILSEEEFYDEAENGEDELTGEIEPPPKASALYRTLYIQEQGAILKKEAERFVVTKEGKELIELPAIKISNIIIFGSCTVSPSVIQFCIRKNIPVIYLSSRGKYYGSIESTFSNDAELERLQLFRTLDNSFLLSFCKETAKAKINNQTVLLQRTLRKNKDEKIISTINYLKRITAKIDAADNIDDIRGYEGVAAANYFSVYGRLFKKETGFYKNKFFRNRRPPLDPVNSMLSFGYTLLGSNIFSFIKARRLNPYCGFFHSMRAGHPALASDLLEEFRFIIDGLVVWVINKGVMKREDFYFAKEPGTPCYLTNDGRKKFIKQFELRLLRKVKHQPSGYTVDYRRCADLQVQMLVQYIRGEKENYPGFKTIY